MLAVWLMMRLLIQAIRSIHFNRYDNVWNDVNDEQWTIIDEQFVFVLGVFENDSNGQKEIKTY
jgi:hypothetical protein